MASPLTVWSSTADGYASSTNATYATARSAGTLGAYTAGGSANLAGQEYYGGNYYCYEGFFSFDTSTIASDQTVTLATFSLYGQSDDTSGSDFILQARYFDWGASLTTADWRSGNPDDANSLDEYTLLATHDTASGWPTNAYTNITSQSAFPANVTKAGTTYIVCNSARHLAGTTPSSYETVYCYFANDTTGGGGTDRDPKLYVEYSAGNTALTTTSSSAELVSSGLTLSGPVPWTGIRVTKHLG